MSRVFQYIILIFYCNGIYMLNTCEEQTTCHECIRDPSVCVWCAMNELNGTRCISESSYSENWCPDELLQTPTGSVMITDSRVLDPNPEKEFQIDPLKYSLKLRPGAPINVNFSIRRNKDYPVDLYFFTDVSHSMKRLNTSVKILTEKIYHIIRETTNNVHVGMGVFDNNNNLNPHSHIEDTTVTYSFTHHLELTKEFERFNEIFSKVLPVRGNIDVLGGGIDALVQVIVCKELIGWREASRKILVFIPDGSYLTAENGKMENIAQPYGGKCNTKNNVYVKEKGMDHPSVSINELAIQNDVMLLILVDPIYFLANHDLSSIVSGSKVAYLNNQVESLNKSVENVLKTIDEERINLTSSLQGNVQILFHPDCSKSSNNSDCIVKPGQVKTFSGIIKLERYDNLDNFTLDIGMQGTKEKLTLDVEVIKDCDCLVEDNSDFCLGEPRQCGVCMCSPIRYGDRCECMSNSPYNKTSAAFACIDPGNSEICNGRGECTCGNCWCQDGYDGKYCERNIDNKICPRGDNGSACNGRGECSGGTCVCNPEWSGVACECSNSLSGCIGPNHKICNDRGRCVCGSCQCNRTSKLDEQMTQYQDKFCITSPCLRSHYLQCRVLATCLVCHTKTGETCGCGDDRISITWSSELNGDYKNSSQWNICPDALLDPDSYLRYVYRYVDDEYGLAVLLQIIGNSDVKKSIGSKTQVSTAAKECEDKLKATKPVNSNSTINEMGDYYRGIKDVHRLHEKSLNAIIKIYEKEVEKLVAMSAETAERIAQLEQENLSLRIHKQDCTKF